MAGIPTYREIFAQNAHFQRAVNLSMDLGRTGFLDSYIPNRASCEVLSHYLRHVLHPGAERASVLIGPYGKGKSYTLFLALSILSDYTPEAEAAIARVTAAMERVDPGTAGLVRKVRAQRVRMLPVIINDHYLDVRQAFLASLRKALGEAGLENLMPENYFQQAQKTIRRWKENYRDTYQAYVDWLERSGMKAADLENRLKQFDGRALDRFCACHREILSGTEFNPLLESDVPSLYEQVMRLLERESACSGIFVVFDEFGKYLESSAQSQKAHDFRMLQDLAEIAGRSTTPCMMLTCVSHKSISEYASRLSENQQNSFRTIEGRFASIWFNATFQGSFDLIAGALGRDEKKFRRFADAHRAELEETAQVCEQLGCFSEYGEPIGRIVNQCLPMHPLTALALMRLSELAAQNERTLFTFLADPASPLTAFLKGQKGGFALAPVDIVYDYFHETIRENSYDPKLRQMITYTESLVPALKEDEGKLVRAIVLFSMLGNSRVRAVPAVLQAGLQWDRERLGETVQALEKEHFIYSRRSDGVLCLMQTASDVLRQEIESEMELQKGKVDLAQVLTGISDPGYTVPRRYNDGHEMVRFFRNVYLTGEDFLREKSSAFLLERGRADGYVLYLLDPEETDRVRGKLQAWKDRRILVVLPSAAAQLRAAVEETAAIRSVMAKTEDRVEQEELTYYLDDMLAVISRALRDMFEGGPVCVTSEGAEPCRNVGRKVSEICSAVYDRTPIICHEMINRNVLSRQMRQVRERVIDAVLERKHYLQSYAAKSAEGAVMRATVAKLEHGCMQEIVSVLEDFFATCGSEPQPLQSLYDTLTAPPYGMRLGVIPILLAAVLREKKSQVTLYSGRMEVPFRGSSLDLVDTHVERYRILVESESQEQKEYLEILKHFCTPDASITSMAGIVEALTRRVRALPSAARTNRKTLSPEDGGEVVPLPSHVVGIRSQLILFGIQPRETLIRNLPEKAGVELGADCAGRILDAMDELEDYLPSLLQGICAAMQKCLGVPRERSVRDAAAEWLRGLSLEQRTHAYDSTASAVLEVMGQTDLYPDESWWVRALAKAVTHQNVEDWSDRQVESFEKQMRQAIAAVEQVADRDADAPGGDSIRMEMDGQVIRQTLGNQELGDLGQAVYRQIRSMLDEYNESISGEEKLRVLMKVILSLTGEK